jgi:hypothetical protein
MKISLTIFIIFGYISGFVLQNKQESNIVDTIFYMCCRETDNGFAGFLLGLSL